MSIFYLNNLQEEFKTLEEKATKVLEDYEKAQVSHKYNLEFLFIICPRCVSGTLIMSLKSVKLNMCLYWPGASQFSCQAEYMKL